MANKSLWKFNETNMSEELIFNPILEDFYKAGIEGLVRENIQNSLDGRLYDDKEVEVHINIDEMKTSDIPGIDNIKKHIDSLIGGNKNTIETIEHMKKSLKKKNIKYISFEDRNTKGLKGARNGYNYKDGDTYGIYAYQKGVHNIVESEALENLRGGSHGVGKIASNAASDINLMFFSNCDENNDRHLGGTIQLIEHKINDTNYRATGYFTDEVDGIFYPYPNDGYHNVFEKNSRGLKIVIPFLRKDYTDVKDVIRAVCDNFFMAIIEKRLIVFINREKIDSKNLVEIVNREDIYEEQNPEDMKKTFTKLYISTYENEEPEVIEIKDKRGDKYQFYLYLAYNTKIKRGKVGVVRSIGMKIEDLKIDGHAKSPFNALIIPKTNYEDKFLKSLENESHTKLSHKHIKDVETNRNALRFINNLNKKIKEYIDDKMKSENPSDGAIDTGDILYSVENSFKKSLAEATGSIELNKGKRKKKQRLIKRKKNIYEPKDQGSKEPKGNTKDGKKRDNANGKNTTLKKNYTYFMSPEFVKRISVGNTEIVRINLAEHKSYSGETECNLSMKIIDGMGKEDKHEFNLQDLYSEIVDKNTGNRLKIKDNKIENVSIMFNTIDLQLKLNTNANTLLKFIYVVEV